MAKQRKTPLDISRDRRSFLLGLGAGGSALLGAAAWAQGTGRDAGRDTGHDTGNVTDAPFSAVEEQRQPFTGVHQSGIVTPRPAAGLIAAFDVLATTPEDLVRLFKTLNARIAFLMAGGTPPQLDPRLPPADSGLLGPSVRPDNLTVTVSIGASLFDDRYGLASLKPAHLTAMGSFKNDELDPNLCHGDLSLQFCANTPDTNIHALRDIIKSMSDLILLRWKQEGYVPALPAESGKESARNFLGFRDGTANPDATDAALMDDIVWVRPGGGEPVWASGGSYQVVRLIRMFVERWDRTPLREQEHIIGRKKASGAPFDGKSEFDAPNYAGDPEGKMTPLDAHIRLANPRTQESRRNLILRRPFNYSNGVSKSGQLEMGLLFIAYQADLEQGFITVQKKLSGEPLEEYIKPVGGGYFFTLPGALNEVDYLGRTLLQAAGLSNKDHAG